ncbi:MAG: DnaJ domain-containing protein, partial [Anaerolineae bacterium]
MEYKDYYAILGVARDADEATIKSAYRRLARTYHPDVNPDKEMAERRFKEINEAYTVLSDGEKRKLYDSFGSQWDGYQRAGVRPEDMGAGWPGWATRSGGMGQRRRQTYTRTMSSEEFAQIFETLFGTAYGGRSGRSSGSEFSDFFDALFGGAWRSATMQPSRGQDVEMAVPVTLAEAYTGTT